MALRAKLSKNPERILAVVLYNCYTKKSGQGRIRKNSVPARFFRVGRLACELLGQLNDYLYHAFHTLYAYKFKAAVCIMVAGAQVGAGQSHK